MPLDAQIGAIRGERGRRGVHVARILYRFWDKASAPGLRAEPYLGLTDILLAQRVAPIAYARLEDTAAADQSGRLREAYTTARMRSLNWERRLIRVVRALDAAGIDFLIWKGWTLARLYPRPGLRPYGDIDVLVHPDRLQDARRALAPEVLGETIPLDFNDFTMKLAGRSFEALVEASRTVPCHGVPVRILGCEDELRMVCLHLLMHGGERAIWLCDVALLLEASAGEVDFADVLGHDPITAAWIAQAMELARMLLGARTALPAPVADAGAAWTARALLREWGTARTMKFKPAGAYLARPGAWRAVIRDRWPNPIRLALVARLAPSAPPLPAQITKFTFLALDFAQRQLTTMVNRTRRSV